MLERGGQSDTLWRADNIFFTSFTAFSSTMVLLCLGFEVHQPRRINRRFRLSDAHLMDISQAESSYFDSKLDREIFERVYNKCYLPTTNIIKEAIETTKESERPFKVCYSFSGLFLEQLLESHPELIDTIRSMVKTGNVELLCQTHYHSLASIYYDDMSEFREQAKKHRKAVKQTFGYEPRVFENTEFIYNNLLAKEVYNMGFSGIITEGSEALLGGRSPHFVYRSNVAKELRILPRDYKLSDDVGFRFSSASWDGYPLTAEKYLNWIASIADPYVLVFVDYETFGEHVWPEAGIHEFLRKVPEEAQRHQNVIPKTASEVIGNIPPVADVDVYEHGKTISWADERRDLSAWLGNEMQKSAFDMVKSLSNPARKLGGKFLRVWRLLQTSDNYHYMYTGEGGPAEVHSYFSGPVGSPLEIYIAFGNVISNFQGLMSDEIVKTSNLARAILEGWSREKAFSFFMDVDKPLHLTASGYLEFYDIVKRVSEVSIEFHIYNGDLEKWFEHVFGDEFLSHNIRKLRSKRFRGKRLKKALTVLVKKRIDQIRSIVEPDVDSRRATIR